MTHISIAVGTESEGRPQAVFALLLDGVTRRGMPLSPPAELRALLIREMSGKAGTRHASNA